MGQCLNTRDGSRIFWTPQNGAIWHILPPIQSFKKCGLFLHRRGQDTLVPTPGSAPEYITIWDNGTASRPPLDYAAFPSSAHKH